MVLDALKKRLKDISNTKDSMWLKELPNILCWLCTQPTKPTEQSPYFLVYGSEAVLPTNVMWKFPIVEKHEEGATKEVGRVNIISLEEARYAALNQSARYDRNVKERTFSVGDLVLRRI
jgi:hypothetical protein